MKKTRKLNLILLLTLCVVCISMLHPMTARAEGNVPGGKGNHIVYRATLDYTDGAAKGDRIIYSADYKAKEDYEIVGRIINNEIYLYVVSNGKLENISKDHLSDYVYASVYYNEDGSVKSTVSQTISSGGLTSSIFYKNFINENVTVVCQLSGLKIFKDYASAEQYAKNGSLDGMLKEPELDKDWYLKNVGYKVDADDSPTSEAGEDATYITFTWDTDNLQDGDLLEIKTHNYLKKIGGDQISGFHDYITNVNNVSAYSGKYRFSQYDATKAWFNTLDNKPLIFKSYDTDIYYLRPYRNGVYGGWVKITIGRSPVIKGSPYVEDIEYGDFDEDDEWITDEELTEVNGGHHGINQNGNIFYPDTDNPFEGTNVTGIFKWFFDFMKEIPSFLGDLPALVGSIIGFLPSQIIGFIAVGLVVAIILRIVGR